MTRNEGDKPEWILRMLAALGPHDPAKLDVQAAQRAKDPHIPHKLYRYRPCNEYSLQNLRDDTQWMSMASAYNDPYDSAVAVDGEQFLTARLGDHRADVAGKILSEWDAEPHEQAQIESAADPLRAFIDVAVARGEIKSDMAQRLHEFSERRLRKSTKEMFAQMSAFLQRGMCACSFSEIMDSMLMWTHYADQHRGFCFEYDFGALPAQHVRRLGIFPVVYGAERFDATKYFRPVGEDFNNLFGLLACLHKDEAWRYEREWRLVFPFGEQEANGLSVGMPKPSRLYLGARITSEHEVDVRAIASAKAIPVVRMKLSAESYGLDVEAD